MVGPLLVIVVPCHLPTERMRAIIPLTPERRVVDGHIIAEQDTARLAEPWYPLC